MVPRGLYATDFRQPSRSRNRACTDSTNGRSATLSIRRWARATWEHTWPTKFNLMSPDSQFDLVCQTSTATRHRSHGDQTQPLPDIYRWSPQHPPVTQAMLPIISSCEKEEESNRQCRPHIYQPAQKASSGPHPPARTRRQHASRHTYGERASAVGT